MSRETKAGRPKRASRTRVVTPIELPVDATLHEEPDYSDEQFAADLRKASKRLDLMEQQALEEHAQGKTRRFPV